MTKRKERKMQTATNLATVPNPDAKVRPPAEHVTHFRGVTKFRPPPEATIKLERSKHDVIGRMYDRKQINEEQHNAARRFQETHETAGTSLRSSGDIREVVDGGLGPQIPITDARQRAAKRLGEWRALLGESGFGMVVAICVGLPGREPMEVKEYASQSRMMMPSAKSTVFHGQLFRAHLTRLAEAMGYG